MNPIKVHEMIRTAFEMRDNAYAPYSNFHVGAALLAEDGSIIGGCNVENASYGAGICAERTAITKGVSSGHRKFTACVVTSQIPTPSVSPCGICRQVLREFLPLTALIMMVGSSYPVASSPPPQLLAALREIHPSDTTQFPSEDGWSDLIKIMTLEELLPMSFGPEHLVMNR